MNDYGKQEEDEEIDYYDDQISDENIPNIKS